MVNQPLVQLLHEMLPPTIDLCPEDKLEPIKDNYLKHTIDLTENQLEIARWVIAIGLEHRMVIDALHQRPKFIRAHLMPGELAPAPRAPSPAPAAPSHRGPGSLPSASTPPLPLLVMDAHGDHPTGEWEETTTDIETKETSLRLQQIEHQQNNIDTTSPHRLHKPQQPRRSDNETLDQQNTTASLRLSPTNMAAGPCIYDVSNHPSLPVKAPSSQSSLALTKTTETRPLGVPRILPQVIQAARAEPHSALVAEHAASRPYAPPAPAPLPAPTAPAPVPVNRPTPLGVSPPETMGQLRRWQNDIGKCWNGRFETLQINVTQMQEALNALVGALAGLQPPKQALQPPSHSEERPNRFGAVPAHPIGSPQRDPTRCKNKFQIQSEPPRGATQTPAPLFPQLQQQQRGFPSTLGVPQQNLAHRHHTPQSDSESEDACDADSSMPNKAEDAVQHKSTAHGKPHGI